MGLIQLGMMWSSNINLIYYFTPIIGSFSMKRSHVVDFVDMELRPVWKSMRHLESNENSPNSLAEKLNELYDFKKRIQKSPFWESFLKIWQFF